jgi:hypothetical protein
MELNELVGKHILSGVDMSNESILSWGDCYENCQVIRFVLDGKTYMAVEDPNDGYRSSMRNIEESDSVVSNTFPGVEVMAFMKKDAAYGNDDVLELMDTKNGKTILSVGTGNFDDYYPYWVAEFTPENMAINQGRG